MRIGRLPLAVAFLGTLTLVAATARCGSAQEQNEVKERTAGATPFMVRSGAFGGGSYLGVYIAEVDADDVSRLDLKQERGARIESVSEESPAQEAGLEKDDVIVGWNDAQVESAVQLQRLVSETPAGRVVNLKVIRDGKNRDVKVTIGERESMVRSFSFRGPDSEEIEGLVERLRPGVEWKGLSVPGMHGNVFAFMGGGRMGVGVQSVGDQLGEYFGLNGRDGVLVTSVEEDSPAAKAGLKAGDIILTLAGEAVDGPGELALAVREADEGPISVGILRDRQERTITVDLPEAPEFKWEGKDGNLLLRVPEPSEEALLVVPRAPGELHIRRGEPDAGVRIRIPDLRPVVEPESRVRVST